MARGKRPRALPQPSHRAYFSGIELVEAEDANRPLIVGERTNVIGSRLFKNMVAAISGKKPPKSHAGRCATARTWWMCACNPPIATRCRIPPFYGKLIRKIKAPVMIDTTDPKAVELALTYCQGKSIINSINSKTAKRNSSASAPSPGATEPPW